MAILVMLAGRVTVLPVESVNSRVSPTDAAPAGPQPQSRRERTRKRMMVFFITVPSYLVMFAGMQIRALS